MRQGGRLRERLTARDLAGRLKLTFAVHRDSLSLVVMFCNCQIVSKLPTRHLCVVNNVCTSIGLATTASHSAKASEVHVQIDFSMRAVVPKITVWYCTPYIQLTCKSIVEYIT